MLCLDTLQPFRGESARRGSLLGRGTYQSGLGRVGVMVVADWLVIGCVEVALELMLKVGDKKRKEKIQGLETYLPVRLEPGIGVLTVAPSPPDDSKVNK